MNFVHFLITRFNVPLWWSNKGTSKEWLDHRFGLFDKFCFPSVISQTNKNFVWFVLFSKDLEGSSRLMPYTKFPNFKPLFMDYFGIEDSDFNNCRHDGDTYFKPHDNKLKENIVGMSKSVKSVITSRLDNDDAISTDYIDQIQRNFSENVILSFTGGCAFYNNKFYDRQYPNNPFLSLIEPSSNDIKTIYSVSHWKPDNRIKYLKNNRMWLQTIHENNQTNSVIVKTLNNQHLIPFNEANSQFGLQMTL